MNERKSYYPVLFAAMLLNALIAQQKWSAAYRAADALDAALAEYAGIEVAS